MDQELPTKNLVDQITDEFIRLIQEEAFIDSEVIARLMKASEQHELNNSITIATIFGKE